MERQIKINLKKKKKNSRRRFDKGLEKSPREEGKKQFNFLFGDRVTPDRQHSILFLCAKKKRTVVNGRDDDLF